jgi:hypothetical protein
MLCQGFLIPVDALLGLLKAPPQGWAEGGNTAGAAAGVKEVVEEEDGDGEHHHGHHEQDHQSGSLLTGSLFLPPPGCVNWWAQTLALELLALAIQHEGAAASTRVPLSPHEAALERKRRRKAGLDDELDKPSTAYRLLHLAAFQSKHLHPRVTQRAWSAWVGAMCVVHGVGPLFSDPRNPWRGLGLIMSPLIAAR